MKKIILLLVLLLFPLVTAKAITKEEIINYVESKESSFCDSRTKKLFNSYKLLYERMLTERDISSADLTKIYDKIVTAFTLATNNNLCSVSDTSSISSDIKKEIYNNLYNGAMIIYKSPQFNKEETNSTMVIDKSNNKITLYENNTELDVINLNNQSLNYVGPHKVILLAIIFISLLIIVLLSIYFIFKRRFKSFGYNLLTSSIIFLGMILIGILLFNKTISNTLDLVTTLKYQDNTNVKDIIVKDQKIITYPSYNSNYGSLIIKDVNINTKITFGDSLDILNNSIGQSSSSYLPGEKGTIILSGHNSSKYLYNIKDINKKDQIIIDTTYGKFTYEVTKINTIKDTTIIDVNHNKEELIIYTCYPFSNILYGNQRFIVYSKLIESEWY